jgi:hypothetical protein
MKRLFLVFALAALAAGPSGYAQQGGNRNQQQPPAATPNPNRPPAIAVWKAELPGGSYMVARNAILAISSQQYIVDGAARVTEVNISTSSVFQPRFYYLEPIGEAALQNVPGAGMAADRAKAALESAAGRVAPDEAAAVWTKVVKNYPTTTHAGTIEFRLETLEQLQQLLDSVEHAWMTGRSEIFTLEGTKPYRYVPKAGGPTTGENTGASNNDGSANTSNPDVQN